MFVDPRHRKVDSLRARESQYQVTLLGIRRHFPMFGGAFSSSFHSNNFTLLFYPASDRASERAIDCLLLFHIVNNMKNDPQQTTAPLKQRVAVIGGGVSGLAAAWHLQQQQQQQQQDYEDRLGGHAWTVPVVTKEGTTIDVDIGFMVFNHSNYPNMVEWFKALQVPEEESDMSLSVSLDNGNIE